MSDSLFKWIKLDNTEKALESLQLKWDPLALEKKSGQSILHLSIENQNFEIFSNIIEYVQNTTKITHLLKQLVNIENEDGYTALSYAIQYNFRQAVELLLKSGADPNLKSEIGKSTMHFAMENASLHQDILENLINYKADANALYEEG